MQRRTESVSMIEQKYPEVLQQNKISNEHHVTDDSKMLEKDIGTSLTTLKNILE